MRTPFETLMFYRVFGSRLLLPYFLSLSGRQPSQAGGFIATAAMYLFFVGVFVVTPLLPLESFIGYVSMVVFIAIFAFSAFFITMALATDDIFIAEAVRNESKRQTRFVIEGEYSKVNLYQVLARRFDEGSLSGFDINHLSPARIQWLERAWKRAFTEITDRLNQEFRYREGEFRELD